MRLTEENLKMCVDDYITNVIYNTTQKQSRLSNNIKLNNIESQMKNEIERDINLVLEEISILNNRISDMKSGLKLESQSNSKLYCILSLNLLSKSKLDGTFDNLNNNKNLINFDMIREYVIDLSQNNLDELVEYFYKKFNKSITKLIKYSFKILSLILVEQNLNNLIGGLK